MKKTSRGPPRDWPPNRRREDPETPPEKKEKQGEEESQLESLLRRTKSTRRRREEVQERDKQEKEAAEEYAREKVSKLRDDLRRLGLDDADRRRLFEKLLCEKACEEELDADEANELTEEESGEAGKGEEKGGPDGETVI